MQDDLKDQKCAPCEGGTAPFTDAQIKAYLEYINNSWEVVDSKKLTRRFKFKNFLESMAFVNKVSDIAESEGHHPDIYINYNRVILTLSTHAIAGLSKNDFILAAKIDRIL